MACHVIFGNILECNVEAIVNASDKSLSGGGGIDKVIHKAAGKEQLRSCLEGKRLENVGDALITPGFNLKAKNIIHTAGPRCYKGVATEANKKDLARCYINCLNAAKAANIRSVAFPCISTGVYKFPKEEAARIAVEITKKWLAYNNNDFMEVYFVCLGAEDYGFYKNNLTL